MATISPSTAEIVRQSGAVPGETVILNPPAGLTDRGVVRVKGS
jgi:hypothetical protein